MGFLKRTKSFWQEKRSAGTQKPPPLPSLAEVQGPPVSTVLQHQHLPKQQESAHYITAENIRELRELIRHKYALDIEIWKQRDVKEYSRDHCNENMRKSDAALITIKRTVQDWDRKEYF